MPSERRTPLGHSLEHNHLIAGLDAIDFPSVFTAMKRSGYQHDMTWNSTD